MIRALVFACLFAGCAAAEDETPWAKEFEKHRVERPLFLAPRVDLGSHPLGEKYRTRLTEAVKEGPNFGGHLAIIQWGCGTGCIQWVAVDLRSGKIHVDEELLTLGWDPSFDAAGVEDYLTFRADSTLLIVHGLAGEENAKPTRYFLRWDGKRFERLSSESPVTPFRRRADANVACVLVASGDLPTHELPSCDCRKVGRGLWTRHLAGRSVM